ncbi:MAG: aminodeoxychorismate/anthranilate synthase component I [Legionellales bacterium]|nr:aminodeoxychorismate/anthranilate synthase component I [Legionellales bacterium]
MNDSKILVEEIAWKEPTDIADAIYDTPGFVWLDTPNGEGYSYIGVLPFKTLTCKNGVLRVDGELRADDFFEYLKKEMENYRLSKESNIPFVGGAIGFLAYDYARSLESLPAPSIDVLKTPDASVGIYDACFVFDNKAKKAYIVSTGFSSQGIDREVRAFERLEVFKCLLDKEPCHRNMKYSSVTVRNELSQDQYVSQVDKVKSYIREGDIFEANFTGRFFAEWPLEDSIFTLYSRLRVKNGGAFSALYCGDGYEILSVSPEQFIEVSGSVVKTFPIKGTRPRGKTSEQDIQYKNDLLESEKDRAENIMIVDLMRNDFSKVCESSSVKVNKVCEVQTFPTVYHLVSEVEGILAPGYHALDILKACFPAGSITGAPKIRAMEIIAECESTARGIYCGSMFYNSFDGDFNSSVMIRTITKKGENLVFGAGGAVVIDSNSVEEYQEALTKASGIVTVLQEKSK